MESSEIKYMNHENNRSVAQKKKNSEKKTADYKAKT